MVICRMKALGLFLLPTIAALPIPGHEPNNPFNIYQLSAEMGRKLEPQPYYFLSWEGPVPKACEQQASERHPVTKERLGCEIREMSFIEVFYHDAPTSWLFCYCISGVGPNFTQQQLMDEFRRLPVVLRQRSVLLCLRITFIYHGYRIILTILMAQCSPRYGISIPTGPPWGGRMGCTVW